MSSPSTVFIRALRWTTAALRHRRLVGASALLCAVLATVATLVYGPEYTAESSYIPHISPYMSGSAPIQFTALLGGAGVRIPYSEASEQPMFYEELVTSRTILTEVARFTYRFPRRQDGTDSLEGNLLALWGTDGDSEEERLAAALDRLERMVSADMDLRTGIVTVKTRARWPDLAEQMNRRILQAIQEFIFLKRSERYEAMHAFAEGRTQVAARELSSAEGALLDFNVRNRRFDNSPQLELEERRLRDEMERQLEFHTSLLLAAEETSVERLRDTPFITVIDSPEGGAHRTGLRLPLAIPVGLLFGGLLGIAAAVVVDATTVGRHWSPPIPEITSHEPTHMGHRSRPAWGASPESARGAMLTATAGSVLVACGDTTAPDALAIEIAGRLERSCRGEPERELRGDTPGRFRGHLDRRAGRCRDIPRRRQRHTRPGGASDLHRARGGRNRRAHHNGGDASDHRVRPAARRQPRHLSGGARRRGPGAPHDRSR